MIAISNIQPSSSTHPAAKAFEAQMLSSLFALMLEAVEQADGFDGGPGEAMMRPQLAEAMGKSVSARGSPLGIAHLVADQLAAITAAQQEQGQ